MKAAPYLEAAFNQPIEQLYSQAIADDHSDPHAALRLGLALFAGRTLNKSLSDEEWAVLDALDARLVEPVTAYVQKHPNSDHSRVNWRKKLDLTPEELDALRQYQTLFLADYWLHVAYATQKRMAYTSFGRATSAQVTRGGYIGGPSSRMGLISAMDRRIINTAIQCAYAVRQEAGTSYLPPSEQSMSIRILRFAPTFDVEHNLTNTPVKTSSSEQTGKAACGSSEQFERYVRRLKSESHITP